ncbi:REF1 [Auxenochlorella protothecoides x Auxenochlorella symbiontica]|uniref:RRM domain-containing protein n=1 Tax=Auxenochlorella protothecoides TaxID=3075 RepID=A0A1D1ZU49_AUXPR
MAEAALSKSLDEIIAEQRQKETTKREKQTSKRGSKAQQAPATRKGSRGGQNSSRPPSRGAPGRVITVTINRSSGVVKRAGDGHRGRPVSLEDPEPRNTEARIQALEGAGKWGHDMFARAEGKGAAGPRSASALGTKLYITNLHYDVTEGDIKELFSTCGEVIRHRIIFDASGRSQEAGFVVYQHKSEAEAALQRYNGVALDGRVMQIELIPQSAGGQGQGGARTLSSGVRITGDPGQPARGRLVGNNRAFLQATDGARTYQPRGRGSVRSRVVAAGDAMQE